MKKVMDWFERAIVNILIVLMMVIILLAVASLVNILITDAIRQPVSTLDSGHLLEYFGYILLALIGVELLDTIHAYLMEHVIHVEIVLEVALIAVARKIIILDIKVVAAETLLGIAALVAALAISFYLEKRGRRIKIKSILNAEPE
ncbi:MAG: phosphate-starvation-inducible PsiE family protein [Anaerolineaceae bacterium]|nr:phosphate-starvation-inducible PsiE family protein [Anaerolineaceae bacterium]MBN2678049.1 phosphate-starvation-inducible PsiE family protein [Anaerolineaceae bacterium]